jgi:Beta-1,4-xylanase
MMNFIKKMLPVAFVLLAFTFSGCNDDEKGYFPGDALKEPLAALDVLKVYATAFPVGVGVDADLFVNNDTYRNTVIGNFQGATAISAMTHGSVVKVEVIDDESIMSYDFAKADAFVAALPADLSLYGNALVWHQNQNGNYLRGLLNPVAVEPEALLNTSCLKDGIFAPVEDDPNFGDASFIWVRKNNGAGISVAAGEGIDGGLAIKMVTQTDAEQSNPREWSTQLGSPQFSIFEGRDYQIKFNVRCIGGTGKFRVSSGDGKLGNSYPSYDGAGTVSLPPAEWKEITYGDGDHSGVMTATATGTTSFDFDFGAVNNMTYYIDIASLEVIDLTGDGSGGAMTPEEKKEIIRGAMEDWINAIVGQYKNRVNAWDVVKDPMGNDGTVRHGNGTGDTGTNFHWQDFLGDNYAVEAFNLARTAVKDGDKLFISDNGLENLTKCDGLINYVNTIESLGAQVDGIGTQMHISMTQDMGNVASMFSKLAATGKLIKITELDVALVANPTAADRLQQAAVYYEVVRLYKATIPAAQQAGITVWNLTGGPCLWNADFSRRASYKGFVDALTGAELSDFFK